MLETYKVTSTDIAKFDTLFLNNSYIIYHHKKKQLLELYVKARNDNPKNEIGIHVTSEFLQ